MLELCIHNACIVESCFQEHIKGGKLVRKRQGFREELVEQLIGAHQMRSSSRGRPSVAYENEARLQNVGVHLPDFVPEKKTLFAVQIKS